jgi:drug/metabolite transporter (DMT)-like permease
VVATVAGVVLLDESITLATVGGFVVVFAGFALLKRRQLADLVGFGEPAVGSGD